MFDLKIYIAYLNFIPEFYFQILWPRPEDDPFGGGPERDDAFEGSQLRMSSLFLLYKLSLGFKVA